MQHLAIIPDGNRRWAKDHKLESFFGHKKGMDAVYHAIRVCMQNSIKYLTFYTFSLENFNRQESEITYLFELLAREFTEQLPHLVEHGVKVSFLGEVNLFPTVVRGAIEKIHAATQHLDGLHLNLLFCYGSQREIVTAVKKLAAQVSRGDLDIEDISEESVSNALWTVGIPNPDLILRTGGVMRLSNFMLFQAAYSEFMFLDTFWPAITEGVLQGCVDNFHNVQRNFGK